MADQQKNNDKTEHPPKQFHYVGIKTHWVNSVLRHQLISISNDMNIAKSETLRYVRDNSKMVYSYKCKNGILKVQYRGNTLESYQILYISYLGPEINNLELNNITPVTGNIMFVDKDLELNEDEESDFNR